METGVMSESVVVASDVHETVTEVLTQLLLDVLWNRLAMPQDTHYQESNAPSAPLRSTGDCGCAQEENNTTTE